MSQPEAATAAAIVVDKLRRWETGATIDVPHADLVRLGEVYGHTAEHFRMESPPPADLAARPQIFLRTLPGTAVPAELLAEIQRVIDNANDKLRDPKTGKKKR